MAVRHFMMLIGNRLQLVSLERLSDYTLLPMKSRLTILLVLLFFSVRGVAWPHTPETSSDKTCTLEGVVVKDPGGEPIKKVTIQAVTDRQDDTSSYTAVTDAEGRFRMEAVEPGRYRVFSQRTGLIELDNRHHHAEGIALTLQPGQEIKDLVFRMQPAAVLRGRVVDEDGDPMPDVEISVFRHENVLQHRQMGIERSERTNDLGEYRIGELMPGRYYVLASPAPEFFGLSSGKHAVDATKQDMAYVATYYPGTSDRRQASAVVLHPGDELPADFTLVKSPTFRIRGSVPKSAGSHAGSHDRGVVMVSSQDFSLVSSAAEVDQDGNFELRGLSPGSYTVTLLTRDGDLPERAHQTVEVNNTDVNDVRLAPVPACEVRGQIRTEDLHRIDLTQIMVTLRPADGEDYRGIRGSDVSGVKADGTFEFKNIAAGTYNVVIESGARALQDYFLKRVFASGRDIARAAVHLSGGGAVSLELVISPNAGVVEGSVVDDKNQPVGNSVVVVAPDADHRTQIHRFHKTLADQTGHFAVRGLEPGQYTVFAWEDLDEDAYYDPEFLQHYSGERVQVTEGGHPSVMVKVSPAVDE